MSNAKILTIDIETAPNIVYTWGLYDQNIGLNQIVQDGYILCWAAKWLGEKKILSDSLIRYPRQYRLDHTNYSYIINSLWRLLDEADIVVGQNIDEFDLKWINTGFLLYGHKPPSPYKTVDTLKTARNFMFPSRKLDYQCTRLGLGEKLVKGFAGGDFELWKACMSPTINHKAWNIMEKYNKHDVVLAEKLYLKSLGYVKHHPNMGLFVDDEKLVCINCGSSNLHRKGLAYAAINVYQRYVCSNCGKQMRGRTVLKKPVTKVAEDK